ncbi:HAMP domain-containing sensor histidine kinase [Nonomuraea roseoviolacea subsp. roseoviolacea]|uniref:histidine kinase n=1 Tax=Nonomuraea roseoviolacea subsp. carminata TaxID=160689 RepID=A0ABT1KF16_9ACTN|nr:ATP-binding protein [Nonomuraea roseoviolacea]MCP2352605.1 signal transduction histidine kinase [Nonomuraea roseoviolacea subsp. carminata]
MADSPLAWWRRQGLRFRLSVVAAAVLAAALALSASVLLNVLDRALVDTIDETTWQQAQTVRVHADAGTLTNPITTNDGTIVQVIDASGRITHATYGTDRLVPLLGARERARVLGEGSARFMDGRPYAIPGPLRVVAVSADHGRTVLAARPVGEIQTSVGTAGRVLLVGTPLLVVVLALASWVIIGRTLRPIAALRRGAAEITHTARSRRLPVPESRDEVHSLAVTLNGMLARLEEAEQRQRALVSDAAHELRSPLASIRLQLEVALGHPEGQDWPETAEGVLEDAMRLSRLAEDLLALARLDERGGVPARSEPVDLDEVVRQTVDRYGEAQLTVCDPVVVRGDALDLSRVLTNLVDNAVRHTSSKVEVALTRDGVLTVTDDGPGIPEADRERVFNRFTRLDSGRSRDEGGAGLGLAIVRETVRAHGGTVHLEDAGPGLRAVVRLPPAV